MRSHQQVKSCEALSERCSVLRCSVLLCAGPAGARGTQALRRTLTSVYYCGAMAAGGTIKVHSLWVRTYVVARGPAWVLWQVSIPLETREVSRLETEFLEKVRLVHHHGVPILVP